MDHFPGLSEDGRAWAEIDLNALAYNAGQVSAMLPDGCKIMAVVKADAYGHGAERTAMRLRREGVDTFAVATISEGIKLRKEGLDGNILVLGYTHPKDAGSLNAFELTQLVVDGAYARALDATGHKLRVHIAVDTGMHRLGIESTQTDEIESVFKCRNLTVEGVASHLASSDSIDDGDTDFTNLQIERFFAAVESLKSKGYDPGKLHIQASYGICNYSGIKCDYARAGITLYGVMSHNAKMRIKPSLKPVLSLRARIAQVRRINAGESVSYGRTFTALMPLMLATVCIGYADGIPRQMSGCGGMCIIHGQKAIIVGRICMDLLMVDVTGIDHVEPCDIATLIGRDGNEEIRCENVAEQSGTITNDILCRLGSRLPRIYLN